MTGTMERWRHEGNPNSGTDPFIVSKSDKHITIVCLSDSMPTSKHTPTDSGSGNDLPASLADFLPGLLMIALLLAALIVLATVRAK
jgi:hypothetical protein